MDRTPAVDDEDIGIRAFQLRKGRAVERAIEKIRQKLGPTWLKLSREDIEMLEWALGEAWALIGRAEWETISFSSIDLATALKIIETGKRVTAHEEKGSQGFAEIQSILKSLETKAT